MIHGKVCCIYKISFSGTNDIYIGSTVNFKRRKCVHLSELKHQYHCNFKLQRNYNIYGRDNTMFNIIEECSIDDKLEREQFYVKTMCPILNIAEVVTAPMQGRKHSEETMNKFRQRIPWNKGITLAEDEKVNIYAAASKRKGTKHNKNHCLNITNSLKLYHSTPEAALTRQNVIKKSKETRIKRPKYDKILCITTGEIFDLKTDIIKKYDIPGKQLDLVLAGKAYSNKGYEFKWLNSKRLYPRNKQRVTVIDCSGKIFYSLRSAAKHHRLGPRGFIKMFNKHGYYQQHGILVCRISLL